MPYFPDEKAEAESGYERSYRCKYVINLQVLYAFCSIYYYHEITPFKYYSFMPIDYSNIVKINFDCE